ncbi:MAG: right-handed parallel beta-helix repeat-containing protein [Chloroflexi bacterium]|nr:right-handed parallel beta-helix repeat-containing protein [Chloroflexota bacterium]
MYIKKSISRVSSILFILVFMVALTFSALDVTPAHAAGVRYAMPSATGTGNCLSWMNACTLQTALAGAVSGNEIWAAAGVYKPTAGTDRTATFQLKVGVALYGGFAGTETERSQRNPAVNVTILSGDLNGDDVGFTNNYENVYQVVIGATAATLDGFIITAGNANGLYPNSFGGGMYNYSSSPTLTNVTFSGNSAGQYGGGMYNHSGSPTLTNITFSGNSATYYGGGMYNEGNSKPTLTNVTFSGNSATHYGHNGGGGIYNDYSSPTLTNVTFSGNSAQSGGGIYNYYSSPAIRNTILWGNTASTAGAQIYNDNSFPVVSDSVVKDGYAGSTNIITADPRLGTLGDYGGFTQTIPLQAGSSAIDTGNDAVCPATDQRGVSRPQGAHCDIGAFELVDTTAPETTIIEKPANLDNDSTPTFTFSGDDGTGSGVASFICRMDGGTYADCTSPFTSPILADGLHTFYVYAIDMLGNADAYAPASHTWTLDSFSPNVASIVRANPNPTDAASVDFIVIFSDAVTDVDGSDFTIIGTTFGPSVTGVSGGPIIYTVNVNTGTGSGDLRLDVPISASITSLAGHLLAGLPYTGGDTYIITKVFTIFLPLILH